MMFIDQQLRRIRNSQIHNYAKINIFIHGEYCNEALELVNRTNIGANIRTCEKTTPGNLGDYGTIRKLYEEKEPGDRILYMHTKAISYMCGEKSVNGMTLPRHLRALTSWRWAMEYYLLDRWVERVNCFSLDPTLSVQGILLMFEPYWNYNGNFWWTRYEHLNELPHPDILLNYLGPKDASKSFIMVNKPRHHNLFQLLDKPREDAHLAGRDVWGAFRMHEDDCMPYVLENRNQIQHPPMGPEHLIHG